MSRGGRARAAAAALAVAAACQSSPKPPPVAPQVTPPAVKPSAPDDFALLPVDSELVFGVDFAQLSHSAVWQTYVEPKLAAVDGLQKFKALCGFDLVASLQSFAVGIRDMSSSSGMIVLHGLDRAKSMTCFDNDGLAEVQKDGTKVVIDHDVVLLTDPAGRHIGFTFVDDKTAVAVIGPDGVSHDSVRGVTAGTRGLKTSPAFLEMYGELKKHGSIWIVARGGALADLASAGISASAALASIDVGDGVALDARLRFTTPDLTTTFVSLAQSQLANPQIKGFFDQLDVTADGNDAHIAVAMTHEKLATVAGMLGIVAGSQ
jgi:hypothetical protein